MFIRNRPVDRNLCFVLMPFRAEMRPIYNKVEEVTVLEFGLTCQQGNDVYTPRGVVEEIWNRIQEAQIIIADVTGKNPNVLYEMGLAHAIGKNIVIITQSEDDVPFDLRRLGFIKYDGKRLDELAVRLRRAIDGLKWKPFEINQRLDNEWTETGYEDVKVGLSFPTDEAIVHRTPISAYGQVEGLPANVAFWIQGYVITDQVYDQGGAAIDQHGYWVIDEIHLGAVKHKLYFEVKVLDKLNHVIAQSKKISIQKQ